MTIDDFARDATHVLVADAGVIFALRVGKPGFRETEGQAIFPQKIFLLESEPGIWVVQNRRPGIGGMRSAIGMQDLVHHNRGILPGFVGINGDRLQYAVGAVSLGLPGRTTIESPVWDLLQSGKGFEVLN